MIQTIKDHLKAVWPVTIKRFVEKTSCDTYDLRKALTDHQNNRADGVIQTIVSTGKEAKDISVKLAQSAEASQKKQTDLILKAIEQNKTALVNAFQKALSQTENTLSANFLQTIEQSENILSERSMQALKATVKDISDASAHQTDTLKKAQAEQQQIILKALSQSENSLKNNLGQALKDNVKVLSDANAAQTDALKKAQADQQQIILKALSQSENTLKNSLGQALKDNVKVLSDANTAQTDALKNAQAEQQQKLLDALSQSENTLSANFLQTIEQSENILSERNLQAIQQNLDTQTEDLLQKLDQRQNNSFELLQKQEQTLAHIEEMLKELQDYEAEQDVILKQKKRKRSASGEAQQKRRIDLIGTLTQTLKETSDTVAALKNQNEKLRQQIETTDIEHKATVVVLQKKEQPPVQAEATLSDVPMIESAPAEPADPLLREISAMQGSVKALAQSLSETNSTVASLQNENELLKERIDALPAGGRVTLADYLKGLFR